MPSFPDTLPHPARHRAAGLVTVDGRAFPLRSAALEARADGGVAATVLRQHYQNPYAEPLEVLYTLPLPADGSVTGYTITIGERVIRGEVRPREEARQEYERALIEGRTAGLLEQDRADTFTQKLGSLPAGLEVAVEIETLQPLGFLPAADERPPRWEYRFPTVVGVRYQGAPGRVPDAERLDPDRADGGGTPLRLDATLLIAGDGMPEPAPHAPHHDVELAEEPHGTRVTLREAARLDRDLVIRWTAARDEVGVRLVEGPGLDGDDGRYALLSVTPPRGVAQALPRDLTLLIDASGSMDGQPIRRAREISERLVRSLEPGDRFEILAFASEPRRLVDGTLEATPETIELAVRRLRGLRAGGGTEMASAITEALRPLRPDSQRQVVLLTDGYVGFEGEVIQSALQRLRPGARVHTVGIGSAPGRTLTRALARAGRGVEVLVGDDDGIDEAAGRLLRATVRPVLTELEVRGSAVAGVAPQRPGDVFAGEPRLLALELEPAGGTVEVRGRLAGSDEPWVQVVEVPSTQGESDAALPAGALYGRETIEDIELRLVADAGSGKSEAIESEIEAVAMRHRIASRRTSLVAVAEEPSVDPRKPRRRERLPVELPAEVSAEGVGLTGFAAPMLRKTMHLGVTRVLLREPTVEYSADSEPPPSRIVARLIERRDDLLVIEFEVAEDGFRLPGPGTTVTVQPLMAGECFAQIDSKLSSEPGPHAAGLTVRLALRLSDGDPGSVPVLVVHWETDEGEVFLNVRMKRK